MNKTFNEISITINGDYATVTGDEQKAQQVESIWTAIGEIGEALSVNKHYAVREIANGDFDAEESPCVLEGYVGLENPLDMFGIQQQDLSRMIKQIASEWFGGDLSDESIGRLGQYANFQLSVLILFGIDKSDMADAINYLLDEQLKNYRLELKPRYKNVLMTFESDDGKQHVGLNDGEFIMYDESVGDAVH